MWRRVGEDETRQDRKEKKRREKSAEAAHGPWNASTIGRADDAQQTRHRAEENPKMYCMARCPSSFAFAL